MSNINVNNQTEEACRRLIKLIPVEEFYTGILTRTTILNLYDKYSSSISSLPLNENQKLRCLSNNFLRYINMSIQSLDVLMVLGLKNISILDMKSDIKSLVSKLVNENTDSTDSYIIERILSQINNNLPHDLRGKFTPTHKQNIIKLLNNYTPFKDNLNYLKNDKKQFDVNKFEITKYGINNKENFTSLTNNYLDDLFSDIPSANDYNNLKQKGYELDEYLNSIRMEVNKGTYEEQLQSFLDKKAEMKSILENTNNKETSNSKLMAMYIDKDPSIQYSPVDKKFYFYDHSSGTLIDADEINTMLNINVHNDKPKLSLLQKKLFEKTLQKYNLPKDKIDNAVKYIETVDDEEDIYALNNISHNNIKELDTDINVSVESEMDETKLDTELNFFNNNKGIIIFSIIITIIFLSLIFLEYKYKIFNNLFKNNNSNLNLGKYKTHTNNKMKKNSNTMNKLKASIKSKLSSNEGSRISNNNNFRKIK